MDYRKIIDSFRAGRLKREEIQQHLSDLMLLMDFSSSLNCASGLHEIADLLLLTLMGYAKARHSALYLYNGVKLELLESKGSKFSQKEIHFPPCPSSASYYLSDSEDGYWTKILQECDAQIVIPVTNENRLLAVVCLGGKADIEKESLPVLVSLSQLCAGILENARTHQKLQQLNRQLTLKVYQLKTLFDLSKDFNAIWDSEGIFRILGSSLIGQLLVSRCAVLSMASGTLQLKFLRGFRWRDEEIERLQQLPLDDLFSQGRKPLLCSSIDQVDFRESLEAHKIHLVIPMILNDETRGMILLGEKKNRKAFSEEEFEMITALGNLALVADENAGMQQEMIEKQRMERELDIARQIQVGLLPQAIPKIRGYEITSVFTPCYTVGGDYFDFLPVNEEKIAIAIGDVSGKSTPAALLMASLQASLRALSSAGITEPVITIERLNQLLCDSQSQSSKYVTFFYCILEHGTGALSYVNAGHCYPLIVKADGQVHHLEIGGTVLGFFRDANYRRGEYNVDPGDVVIFYTDGVSEMTGVAEEEFGVDRIIETVRRHQVEPVDSICHALEQALNEHRGSQHPGDDITFILLKRV